MTKKNNDVKRSVGRPMKFGSPEELEQLVESYFEDCKQRNEPPFICELAVWLDTSRETLSNYEEKDGYFDTIKRAKQRCESAVEKGMMTGKLNATASIFNLKNNYGWEDKVVKQIQGDEENPLTINTLTNDANRALSILEDETDEEPKTCESSEDSIGR